jgi:methionyl-tRNA formyltransferase
MKVAALIRDRPHTRYFVNQIHEAHELSLVVVEASRSTKKLSSTLKKQGVRGLAQTVIRRYASHERIRRLNGTFGEEWKRINPALPVLVVDSINAPEVYDRLRALAPDLLLDHGTSIVEDRVLDTAGLALNLHWGLSPYYKGVACTEWALLNWDPYNIGVTIHVLSKHIDGGHIVAQEHVEVKPGDRVEDINHRITAAGTQLVKRIIAQLRDGEVLDYVPQRSGEGQLYLKMHFSKHLQDQIRYIEHQGLVEHMLAKPSRKERLPIVRLGKKPELLV